MSEPPAPTPAPPPSRPPRRRPGRVRRWVVRPFFWGLLLLVVLLVAVYFFVESRFAHRRAVAFTVARLSEFLQRDVQVGSVEYDFTPLAFELRDVVVPGPQADDPPVARLPLVRATFSWRDLRQRVLRLEQIDVIRPQIYIRLNPDGTTNLPELRARGGGKRRFETQIGRIVVQDGTLQLDERRLPLDIDARAVWGRLVGSRTPDGKIRLDSLVTAQEVVTTLPDANPYPFTLSVKGSFVPGRIGIENARVSGPDLQAQVQGAFSWQGRGQRQLGLEAQATGSAQLASRLGYVDQPIDGPFDFKGRFDMRNRDWSWSGDVTSPRFQFENRILTGIAARLVGGRETLVADIESARYADGNLAGRVTVDLADRQRAEGGERRRGRPVELDLDLARLSLQPLLRDQFAEEGVPDLLAALSGRISGDLLYRFRSDAILRGSGRADLRTQGLQAAAGELPLSGNIEIDIDNGVVSGRGLQLQAPDQVIQIPRFAYDMDRGSARVEYRLVSQDVGRLQPLFPTDPGEERPFWLPTTGQGTGEGTLEIARGGRFSTRLAIDLRNVATPDFTAETVTGSLSIRPEAIEDLQLEARKGQGTIQLTGRVPLESPGRRPQPLSVAVQADRWSAAEIAAFLMPEDFPDLGPISGTLSGQVDLTGTAEALQGQARFTGTAVRIGDDFRAETVEGSLALRPDAIDNLQVLARLNDSTLALSGRIPLGDEGRPATGAMDLTVQAESWPTAGVVPFLKIAELPEVGEVAGTVTGRLALQGRSEELSGRADVRFDDFAWQGNRVGQVEAAVAFQEGGVTVEQGVVRTPAGEVLVEGSLARNAAGDIERLDFTVDAPALNLAAEPLRQYLGGRLTGEASLAASVGGTLERPDAMVVVRGRDLVLSGRRLGNPGEEAEALVTWNGQALRATGSLLGLASFEGGGRLDQRGADVSFDVRSEALGTLARLALPQTPAFEGSLTGTLGYTADFQAGSHRGVLRLADLRLDYQGQTITNLEPIVVVATPERLDIRSLYLGEPGTPAELFVTGDVGLAGETMPLDLRFQGTLPLVWAELAVPDIDVEGQVELIGTARGTLTDPQLNGLGEIRQARLILPDFPQAIEGIQGTVYLNRDALVLDGVRARMGGGTLLASGQVELPDPGESFSYRLNVAAQDLSLRYPEGWLVRGDAEVTLLPLDGGGQQVRGIVTLERAFYVEDVELGLLDLLEGLFQRERLEVPETEGFLATTQLNLGIEGPGALQIRNNVANLQGDIDLTVRGTLAAPVVFGGVEIATGGTLIYGDNEYRIERGLLTFNNPSRIDPLIDLVARTEVRNFDITLSLTGTLERFDLDFASNSDLADLEIFSLLATGQEDIGTATGLPSQPGQQDDPGAGQAARNFLYGQAASAVSERVNTLFGFDRFRISPFAETGQGITGVSVTVGKRLSRDLFVTYTTNPSPDERSIVQFEWRVSNNVILVGTITGRERYAVDVQWEKRF